MALTRRECLAAAATAAVPGLPCGAVQAAPAGGTLARPGDFAATDVAYLDSCRRAAVIS